MNNQLDDLCKPLHLTHVARQVNEIKCGTNTQFKTSKAKWERGTSENQHKFIRCFIPKEKLSVTLLMHNV